MKQVFCQTNNIMFSLTYIENSVAGTWKITMSFNYAYFDKVNILQQFMWYVDFRIYLTMVTSVLKYVIEMWN